jgi:hypothetical protein
MSSKASGRQQDGPDPQGAGRVSRRSSWLELASPGGSHDRWRREAQLSEEYDTQCKLLSPNVDYLGFDTVLARLAELRNVLWARPRALL